MSIAIKNLRCEYKKKPLGIDVLKPRLSWKIKSDKRGVTQTAYQIRVAGDEKALAEGSGLLWDSGKVASDQSIHCIYDGDDLKSSQRCCWQVRVWDGGDQPSEWSKTASWEMGLLDPSDWKASWVHPDIEEDASTSQPAQMLRTTFAVDGNVKSARAYITSLGLYEMELNGQRVGDQLLTPGWTSYRNHIQYQTYDVTDHLQSGENAIGVSLGDGWYRGFIGFQGQRNFYGDKLALLLQIQITCADGSVQTVISDENWKSATGAILKSDIYNGESYDARLEKAGWSQAGYNDGDWAGVQILDHSKEILVAPAGVPVRKIGEVKPVEIIHTPAGETVFDMGQNMVGWIRLKVQGEAGTTVTIKHAEVLDQAGNFYITNLRSAKQTVEYTLKGGEEEVFEPHFTFQGFRYVKLEGYPGEPTLNSLTGVVIHSDTKPTGNFECSHPLINQLQQNIIWGQKGNFVDVPTDCPQRDERLGWTGDAQVFVKTATFNMDVAAFFTKWLKDVAADQKEDGSIAHVVPDVLGGAGSAAWADAGLIVPWTIYLQYGDKRILEHQYDSMAAWVSYMEKQAGDTYLWTTGGHFGDWLSYNSADSSGTSAITDKDLIATAFFAYSTDILERTARILGKTDDAEKCSGLLAKVKKAFCEEFVTPNSRLAPNTQTAYVVALMFDLLPEEQRANAAERLVERVRSRGNHLSTGFVGTPYLCHVLSRFGHLDTAYDLLNQETYPSWLYPVKKGATTIWERWDGIKPNGSFQDAGMNSYNHYAYGAIGEWLYGVVAGISADPEAPGYKHILIQPQPGGGLSSVRAEFDSMHGKIASAWTLSDGKFALSVTIPPNTSATVSLPKTSLPQITESGHPIADVEGISCARQEGDDVIIELGSGQYEFSCNSSK